MADMQQSPTATAQEPIDHYDAVIIGAGVGGLYALQHLGPRRLSPVRASALA